MDGGLRASNDWLLWLLGELVAAPEASALPCPRPAGRLVRVDASPLGQPGGTGDDWRRHLAYDLLAGRLHQVGVTDRRGRSEERRVGKGGRGRWSSQPLMREAR